jgi:hypothetical protein
MQEIMGGLRELGNRHHGYKVVGAGATHHLRDVEAAAGPQAAKAAGIVLGWCGRGEIKADESLRQSWKSFKRTRPFWR